MTTPKGKRAAPAKESARSKSCCASDHSSTATEEPTVARPTIANDQGFLYSGVALYELHGELEPAALVMGGAR